MDVKIFHFKCVYFEQPLTENSVFRTTYIPKETVLKTMNLTPSY